MGPPSISLKKGEKSDFSSGGESQGCDSKVFLNTGKLRKGTKNPEEKKEKETRKKVMHSHPWSMLL
jgi:hypothetical protein